MRQSAGRHLVLAMRFADNPTGTAHPDRIRTGNGTSFDLGGGRFVVKPDWLGNRAMVIPGHRAWSWTLVRPPRKASWWRCTGCPTTSRRCRRGFARPDCHATFVIGLPMGGMSGPTGWLPQVMSGCTVTRPIHHRHGFRRRMACGPGHARPGECIRPGRGLLLTFEDALHVPVRIERMRVATHELGNDGDGMELQQLDDELAGQVGVVVLRQSCKDVGIRCQDGMGRGLELQGVVHREWAILEEPSHVDDHPDHWPSGFSDFGGDTALECDQSVRIKGVPVEELQCIGHCVHG